MSESVVANIDEQLVNNLVRLVIGIGSSVSVSYFAFKYPLCNNRPYSTLIGGVVGFCFPIVGVCTTIHHIIFKKTI